MVLIFILIGFSQTFLENTEAYVLLQVRKQDANYSNVDALIHKKVLSGKFDKFSKTVGRKGEKDDSEDELPENGLAIAESVTPKTTKEPDLLDLIGLMGRKIQRGPSGPVFRSKNDGVLFKPEKVRLNNGQSSVYNVNPDAVIVAMRDMLSSHTLKKYIDKLSRKAAAVYRTVENDLQPLGVDITKILFKDH